MSGHTPGPWHDSAFRFQGTRPGIDIGAANNANVALVYPAEDGSQEARCNARLIAAAPELLAALEMVRDADNDCQSDGLQTIPPIARATIDAALAKAAS